MTDTTKLPTKLPAPPDTLTLLGLFATASKTLKYPKLKLTTIDGYPIKITAASARSKYAGGLLVTNGKAFGAPDSKFYGSVTLNGCFMVSSYIATKYTEEAIAIQTCMEAIIADPVSIAKMQGQRYGNCCFCSRELTTKASYTAGYGPVCAEKFGLPWGEDSKEAPELDLFDL